MRDPDVIARVDGDAGDGAENPAIRQRLGPERIDAECRHAPRRRRGILSDRRDGRAENDAHDTDSRKAQGHQG